MVSLVRIGLPAIRAKIIKDRPSKNGDPKDRTYRLNYVFREAKTEQLF